MAKNFETVLGALHETGSDKLKEVEDAFALHSTWLTSAFHEAKERITLLLPPAEGKGASVQPAAQIRRGGRRPQKPALEPVAEAEEAEDGSQMRDVDNLPGVSKPVAVSAAQEPQAENTASPLSQPPQQPLEPQQQLPLQDDPCPNPLAKQPACEEQPAEAAPPKKRRGGRKAQPAAKAATAQEMPARVTRQTRAALRAIASDQIPSVEQQPGGDSAQAANLDPGTENIPPAVLEQKHADTPSPPPAKKPRGRAARKVKVQPTPAPEPEQATTRASARKAADEATLASDAAATDLDGGRQGAVAATPALPAVQALAASASTGVRTRSAARAAAQQKRDCRISPMLLDERAQPDGGEQPHDGSAAEVAHMGELPDAAEFHPCSPSSATGAEITEDATAAPGPDAVMSPEPAGPASAGQHEGAAQHRISAGATATVSTPGLDEALNQVPGPSSAELSPGGRAACRSEIQAEPQPTATGRKGSCESCPGTPTLPGDRADGADELGQPVPAVVAETPSPAAARPPGEERPSPSSQLGRLQDAELSGQQPEHAEQAGTIGLPAKLSDANGSPEPNPQSAPSPAVAEYTSPGSARAASPAHNPVATPEEGLAAHEEGLQGLPEPQPGPLQAGVHHLPMAEPADAPAASIKEAEPTQAHAELQQTEEEQGGAPGAGQVAPEDAQTAGAAAAAALAAAPATFTQNLVSSVRSFLPSVLRGATAEAVPAAGKQTVKVKALEAAEAARQKEAAKLDEKKRQREALERQKAERAKAKAKLAEEQRAQQEEARRREDAARQKEEEAVARRRAREEAAKRERDAKVRALVEARARKAEEAKRKDEAAAKELLMKAKNLEAKRLADEERKRKNLRAEQEAEAKRLRTEQQGSAAAQPAFAAPKQPVPFIKAEAPDQGAVGPLAAGMAGFSRPPLAPHPVNIAAVKVQRLDQVAAMASPASAARYAASQDTGSSASLSGQQAFTGPHTSGATTPRLQSTGQAVLQSYEISPYRSDADNSDDDEETEEERAKKVVPAWARSQVLREQLQAQQHVDPDEIFRQKCNTCSLDEVFGHQENPKPGKRDLSRRTSSGNWIEDRVTWKEELNYKRAMRYL